MSELWNTPSPAATAAAGGGGGLQTSPSAHEVPSPCGSMSNTFPSCTLGSCPHTHTVAVGTQASWRPYPYGKSGCAQQSKGSESRKAEICLLHRHLPGAPCAPKAQPKVLLWPKSHRVTASLRRESDAKPAPCPLDIPEGCSWPASWAGRAVSLTPKGLSLCPPSG